MVARGSSHPIIDKYIRSARPKYSGCLRKMRSCTIVTDPARERGGVKFWYATERTDAGSRAAMPTELNKMAGIEGSDTTRIGSGASGSEWARLLAKATYSVGFGPAPNSVSRCLT